MAYIPLTQDSGYRWHDYHQTEEISLKKRRKTTTNSTVNDYCTTIQNFTNTCQQYENNESFNRKLTIMLKSQTREDIQSIIKIYSDYFLKNRLSYPISYSPSLGVTLEKIQAFVLGLEILRDVTYRQPLFVDNLPNYDIAFIAHNRKVVLEMPVHSQTLENKKKAQKTIFSLS